MPGYTEKRHGLVLHFKYDETGARSASVREGWKPVFDATVYCSQFPEIIGKATAKRNKKVACRDAEKDLMRQLREKKKQEPSVSSGDNELEASPSISPSQPANSAALASPIATTESTETQQSSTSHVLDDKSASTVEPDANTSDNEAILQRALEEGTVEMQIIKCLVQGPARVGKTHVKALIMKKKLEEGKSPSTNCVEQAVRAVCTEKFAGDDESWKEVDAEELMKMLTKEIKHQHESPSIALSTKLSEPVQSDAFDVDEKVKKFVEELQGLMRNCEGPGIKMHQKWIYFVDSGGQPQFHNVLQAFIQNTSILLLVFSLAEKLSAFNKHNIQDEFGCDFQNFEGKTAQKVEDVLKSIASTVHSTVSKEERKIFLIGTFKDIYEKNQPACETIEEKEEKLGVLFKEEEIQAVASCSTKTNFVFPVNGLQAESGEFNDEIICEIRKQILDHFKTAKIRSIPLRWFTLELALERKASSVNRKVLTYGECMTVAKSLHIDVASELNVALEFLQDCSLLLSYLDLDLVFTDPQALLSLFSAIVVKFVSGSFAGNKAEVENYKKAILSYRAFKELLDLSPGLKDVLTCDKLLEIFRNLLIVTKIDEDKYFIPALLPMQDIPTAQGEALSAKSSLVPLVFLFSDKCTPSGFFCAVVVKLLSSNWEVNAKAKAYYSNAVALLHKKCKPKLAITFIDSFKSFEVHCSKEDKLPEIKNEMEEVIESVIHSRKYQCGKPQIAFLCSCSECQFATLEESGDICCDCDSYPPEKTQQERKWLQDLGAGAGSSVAAAHGATAVPSTLTTSQAHVLKDDDCDRLFKFLKAAAPQWGKIANELNFSFNEKTAIPHTPGLNGDEDYFQALLNRWLKREPHLTTVEVLVNALRLAGECRLAYDLEHSSDFMSQNE